MRPCQGNNGAGTHQDGEFVKRSLITAEDAAAEIGFTAEPVQPEAFGEIDAVADVIAVGIGFGILVNGCDKEGRTVKELVFGSRYSLGRSVFEFNRPYHRKASNRLMCN